MSSIDLRAREIAKWRKEAQSLMDKLTVLEEIAATNDDLLLTLHRLSLLLIRKKGDWRADGEALLKKQLSVSVCEWRIFGTSDTAAIKVCAALPVGGKAVQTPLLKPKTAIAVKSYFYLPIRKGRKTAGVLILAARKKGVFVEDGDYDFTRRLAALLSAVL